MKYGNLDLVCEFFCLKGVSVLFKRSFDFVARVSLNEHHHANLFLSKITNQLTALLDKNILNKSPNFLPYSLSGILYVICDLISKKN